MTRDRSAKVFPFRHELGYEARLRDGCLEIELSVNACGSDPVPLAFGFHPYLSAPAASRELWQIERRRCGLLQLQAISISGRSSTGARRPAL